jgi:hypothetical protein
MAIGVIRLNTDKNIYLIFEVTATTTTVPFSTDELARHFGLVPDEDLLIIDKAGHQIIIQEQCMTFDKNLDYSDLTIFGTLSASPPIPIRRPQVRNHQSRLPNLLQPRTQRPHGPNKVEKENRQNNHH